MMIHNDDRQGQTEYLFKHCEKRNAMWIEALKPKEYCLCLYLASGISKIIITGIT